MMLLVATAPMAACRVDGDEEALGAERQRPVPYPERLYTPRPRSAEEVARERSDSSPTELAQQDAGADAGATSRR
jgi:hypothetical protein